MDFVSPLPRLSPYFALQMRSHAANRSQVIDEGSKF
jgi:hypothetical protein